MKEFGMVLFLMTCMASFFSWVMVVFCVLDAKGITSFFAKPPTPANITSILFASLQITVCAVVIHLVRTRALRRDHDRRQD